MAKSGTDFRDCTEIIVAITRDSSACTEAAAAAAAEVAGGMAAGAGAAAAEGAGEAALSPRLLAAARLGSLKLAPERLAQLGRVPTAVADTMAELAERAQQRCSKWARLAGIPALAGCQLASWLGKSSSSSSDLKDAEQPECPDCHAASGGGEGATPQGQDAASVYETYADASLATSLLSCRTAGGAAQAAGAAAAPPVHLAVQCVRHTITSDVPEDPEVAEIVEVGPVGLQACTGHVVLSDGLPGPAMLPNPCHACSHGPAAFPRCLQRYKAVMGERMDVVVGYSATDLDGRFAT